MRPAPPPKLWGQITTVTQANNAAVTCFVHMSGGIFGPLKKINASHELIVELGGKINLWNPRHVPVGSIFNVERLSRYVPIYMIQNPLDSEDDFRSS